MKFRYDKKDDALMIWLSKEPVDFAEQNKGLIVHFSKKNKPGSRRQRVRRLRPH